MHIIFFRLLSQIKGFFLMPVKNALKIWRVVVLELESTIYWLVPGLEFQHWLLMNDTSLHFSQVCPWLWPQHVAPALVYLWPWPLFKSLAQVCQWPWPQHNCDLSSCWRVRVSIGWFYNRNIPQSPGLMIHHPLPPRTEIHH